MIIIPCETMYHVFMPLFGRKAGKHPPPPSGFRSEKTPGGVIRRGIRAGLVPQIPAKHKKPFLRNQRLHLLHRDGMSEVRCKWGSSASSWYIGIICFSPIVGQDGSVWFMVVHGGSGLGRCGNIKKGDMHMANNCSGKGSAETVGLHEIEEDGTEERCCGTCWWEDRMSCICCHEKCERNLQRVGEKDSGCGLWASRGPYR